MQDFCFHIHTPRCGHADKSMNESMIAEDFFNAGFKSIAFTDHNPWKNFEPGKKPYHAMSWDEKEDYLETVARLQKEYEGKMEILRGFEMEFIPEHPQEMKEIRDISDIVVIGEHFCRDKNHEYISVHKDNYVPGDYELDHYADCIISSCEEHYADILAHPDLFMIHKTEFGRKEEEISRRILKTAEKSDIPIEVNMCMVCKNMFFQPCNCTYPRRDFWKLANEYNVRVVYGFDFHGYFNPNQYPVAEKAVQELLGIDVLENLHFCSREELNIHRKN